MLFVEANGARIPAIGLGTRELSGRPAARVVEQALRLGYRHIDTAQAYDNEREVGDGLRASGVRRDDVFLTTKVWTNHFAPHDLERSVKRAGPVAASLRRSVAAALAQFARAAGGDVGRAVACEDDGPDPSHRRLQFHGGADRAGGRAVAGAAGLQPCRIPPLSGPAKVRAACDQHGLALVAYSPIAGTHQVRPDARRDRTRPPQIAGPARLRWLVQQNVAAIPRTSRVERLSENIEIFDFELSEDEMSRIAALASPKGRLTDFGFAPKWD